MKKEWIVQLVALVIYYLDSIKEVSHEGVEFSATPGKDLLYILFHLTLLLAVNYILIPKLFNKKKYFLFFVSLVALIVIYGVLEEAVVERMLDPNSRGRNPVNWQSIYWFFGEIMVPLLAFMSIKFVFDNIERQKKLEEIEKNSLRNELKFLKSQIQPHILFNSLNNIYEYTLSKSDKAPELVLLLSNVLRYVLYETTTEKVPLSDELKFIEDYIELQKIQLEGRGESELCFKGVRAKGAF